MKSERLDSLVRKLTPSIRETKLNLIYKELVNGPLFDSLSKVLDAKSFVVLSYLIFFNKKNKYVKDMSTVIEDDLFTFSFIEVDENVTEHECSECYGEGHFTCHNCDGDGTEDCIECGGNGTEDCDTCDGTGEDESGDTCQTCSGNAEFDCDECSGRGKITCDECDGAGHSTCDYCDGDGHTRNEDEYQVTQYTYASIDEKIFPKLKELDEQETIGDDLTNFIEELGRCLMISADSYSTEDLTNLMLDDGDVIFVAVNDEPHLVYLTNGITDNEITSYQ